jgi:hypothetical protein
VGEGATAAVITRYNTARERPRPGSRPELARVGEDEVLVQLSS